MYTSLMEDLKKQLLELWKMRVPPTLLDIIESYRASYLIGYDEDKTCEQKYEVDFEALVKYSRLVRNDAEGNKDSWKIKVKSGKPGTDDLAQHTSVKYMADWINHYSGKDSIEPPILKTLTKARNLPSLIKYTFKDCSLSEEVKEREGKWLEEFMISVEEIRAVFELLYAANCMKMTATEEYGGLVDMIGANIGLHIKGVPAADIVETLAKLGDPVIPETT